MSEAKDWKIKGTRHAFACVNPIRKITDGNDYVPNPDKEVIKLNIGDPTFFGNLPASPIAVQALADAVLGEKANGYQPTVGMPKAREAIAAAYTFPDNPVSQEDVYLTSGCAQAIEFTMTALMEPGTNALVPRPGFSLYQVNAESLEMELRHYNLLPEKSWEADTAHLESLIDEKTRLIVLINPSNPCGSVYSKEHLLQIAEVAEKHRLPILSDEIYEGVAYNGGVFYHLASLTHRVPIVACSGLAKKYLVPGWRTGWLIIYDKHNRMPEIRQCVRQLSSRILGSNTPVQAAIPRILSDIPAEFFAKTTSHLEAASQVVFDKLSAVPCLEPIKPRGAMYMLIGIKVEMLADISSDIDFCPKLMAEESVFILPASIFKYPNYFRVVLLAPVHLMTEAVDRIAAFCQRHTKQ